MSSAATSKRLASTFVEEYDNEKRSRTTDDTDDSRSSTFDDHEERTLKMAAAIKTVLEVNISNKINKLLFCERHISYVKCSVWEKTLTVKDLKGHP